MSKMYYFSNKFSKIAFDFGDLKLRDLAKLCFFPTCLIMMKSNLKNQS